MRNAVTFLISLIVCTILLSLWGYYLAIRPFRITSSITPASFSVPFENVTFDTEDGVKIKGWFIPSTNKSAKTIVLLHGYPADKGNILPAMIKLHPHYNLLFFDFRYFGASGGKYSTIGKQEVQDLAAAILYLKSRKINQVGVWGFSMGGAVALMAAENIPEIKAIVAESSYARLDWMADEYYHIPILRYPLTALTRFWAWLFLGYDITTVSPALSSTRLNIPILLIHSKADEVVPFQHALLLQESMSNNKQVTTLFPENLSHGEMMENHLSIVKAFFDRNL